MNSSDFSKRRVLSSFIVPKFLQSYTNAFAWSEGIGLLLRVSRGQPDWLMQTTYFWGGSYFRSFVYVELCSGFYVARNLVPR